MTQNKALCSTVPSVDPPAILERVVDACRSLFPQGIHDAYLYGSYARGEQEEGSDIDILLAVDAEELGPYHSALAEIESDLSLEYEVLVSVVVVSLAHFRRFASALPFYRNVLREGMQYAGTEMQEKEMI